MHNDQTPSAEQYNYYHSVQSVVMILISPLKLLLPNSFSIPSRDLPNSIALITTKIDSLIKMIRYTEQLDSDFPKGNYFFKFSSPFKEICLIYDHYLAWIGKPH